MKTIIVGIGAACCAIIMGLSALLDMNYLEVNTWWFLVLEPVLIVITMAGDLLMTKRTLLNYIAIGLFVVTTVVTSVLTIKTFNYGEQISYKTAIESNNATIGTWNTYAPKWMQVAQTTEASYMDKVALAGIRLLRQYGAYIHHDSDTGYFALNIILYALLFPGIALYFAILWRRKQEKDKLINYSAITICIGTLIMSLVLFATLPIHI